VVIPQITVTINNGGRAMARSVGRRLLTAKDRVKSLISAFEICGGQSDIKTDLNTSVPPDSTIRPTLHIPASFIRHRRYITLATDCAIKTHFQKAVKTS
jgi:hypothetical protein